MYGKYGMISYNAVIVVGYNSYKSVYCIIPEI